MKRTLLLLWMVACTPATSPATGSACERACSTLAELGCPEGQPTPRGKPCLEVCHQQAPLLRVDCVAEADTVEDVRQCSVRCVAP
jgi:hypothetical protein